MTVTIKGVKLSNRTVAYLTTILWAETVSLPVTEDELVDGRMDVDDDHVLAGIEECTPLDDHFEIGDFDAESLQKAEDDCNGFFDRMDMNGLSDAASECADDDTIVHDFWLTRNGHGAGFWDGDYDGHEENLGDNLTELSKDFAGQHVLVNEDGSLSLEDG